MKRKINLRKIVSLLLVLVMCVSLLGTAVFAAAEDEPQPGTVEVDTLPGGEISEEVDVTITVEPQADGTVETTVETAEGGDLTDSGLTVTFTATTVTEPAEAEGEDDVLLSSESEYEVSGNNGIYTAEGGSETALETVLPGEGDELSVDVMKDGASVGTDTAASGTAGQTETVPTHEGDETKAENPAEYDQTTTTVETDRVVTVTDITAEIKNGDAIFVDKDGLPVDFEAEDGFNYYYSTIYCVHNMDAGACPSCDWSVGSRIYWYAVKNDGTGEKTLQNEAACQRVVACDNGTPDDPSDDYEINGLYCLDASTGINSAFQYRKANLEDAIEEGYYSEEDVAHLRAIMKYGYTWDDDEDDGLTNLQEIKDMITTALAEAEDVGDTATVELLSKIDVENLTRQQAASATGMAVWHFGNRFNIAEDEHLEGRNSDKSVVALYEYLITLEAKEAETEIINEEKFIDNMELIVGAMAQGAAANADMDNTNDVYDVSLKFSLVVEPNPETDDLLVKVLDSHGVEVASARIAGEQKEGEDYLTPDESGNYLMTGMQLAEGANTEFNLKLEGAQYLTEGVYVFESRHYTLKEAVDETYNFWTSDANWAGEQAWAAGKLGISIDEMTKERYKEEVMNFYFNKAKYKNPDGSYNWDATASSQNFIGKFEGKAEVDVGMSINLTFNVEESTVLTERVWRSESINFPVVPPFVPPVTPTPTPSVEPTPEVSPEPSVEPTPEVSPEPSAEPSPEVTPEPTEEPAPEVTPEPAELPDEEVPLADIGDEETPLADMGDEEVPLTEIGDEEVPLTGDVSTLFAAAFAASGLGLSVLSVTGKRKKNDEE